MTVKLSGAGKKALRGAIGIVIMGIALGISAYSIYYVARHLGTPRIFAACFSTAYDGVAVFAADKSLQYAQEGRSGAFPRIVMAVMVGVSAWLNALHPILGHENLLVIPMWAGLPISVAAAFELHTSQARAKAHARLGYQYPAPMPKWAGFDWLLFPLDTLDKFRDIARSRSDAVALANSWLPKSERSGRNLALERNRVTGSVTPVTGRVTGSVTDDRVTGDRDRVTEPVTGDRVTDRPPEPSGTAPEDARAAPGAARVTEPATPVTEPVASRVTPPRNQPRSPVTGLGLARNCEQCGHSFVAKPTAKHARFCKDSCRVAWNRAKKRNEEAS